MAKEKDEAQEQPNRDWHRLFALGWLNLLKDQPAEVDWEFETTRTVQYLDVLIVRKGKKRLTVKLPDGFEPLAAHNLITFKAFKTLDAEALEELICHFVNYRKHVSPKNDLPESDFRLFAVCVHFPHNSQHLFKEGKVSDGVYRFRPLSQEITIVVTSQLPLEQQNALMCLFSTKVETLQYGKQHYTNRSDDSNSLFQQLFDLYLTEAEMPLDLKEFARQTRDDMVARMTPEQRQELIAKFPLEERLAGLGPEERLAGLGPEQLEQLKRMLEQKRADAKPK